MEGEQCQNVFLTVIGRGKHVQTINHIEWGKSNKEKQGKTLLDHPPTPPEEQKCIRANRDYGDQLLGVTVPNPPTHTLKD